MTDEQQPAAGGPARAVESVAEFAQRHEVGWMTKGLREWESAIRAAERELLEVKIAELEQRIADRDREYGARVRVLETALLGVRMMAKETNYSTRVYPKERHYEDCWCGALGGLAHPCKHQACTNAKAALAAASLPAQAPEPLREFGHLLSCQNAKGWPSSAVPCSCDAERWRSDELSDPPSDAVRVAEAERQALWKLVSDIRERYEQGQSDAVTDQAIAFLLSGYISPTAPPEARQGE